MFESTPLLGHEHFVSCVLSLPPSPNLPTGAILSGGYDRTMSGQTIVAPVINVWIDGSLAASLKVNLPPCLGMFPGQPVMPWGLPSSAMNV